MAYTPLQTAVFNAAIAGALAGTMAGKGPVASLAATYSQEANAAFAIAQEFDTLYGVAGSSSQLSLDCISSVVQSIFARGQVSAVAADYALEAAAAVALVTELNVIYAAAVPAGVVNSSNFRARNVRQTNLATLGSYTVASAASNDNVLNVQGDVILLAAQTTGSENGPWVVGLVTAGVAPLTRPSWWQNGATIQTGTNINVGGEGTLFKNTQWAVMLAADSFVVGTTAPEQFPRVVNTQLVLVAGTATTGTTIPIRSLKTGVVLTRTTGNTPAATVMYAATVANVSGITPGAIGTGALVIQSCVAAGTINNADISTMNVTIINGL